MTDNTLKVLAARAAAHINFALGIGPLFVTERGINEFWKYSKTFGQHDDRGVVALADYLFGGDWWWDHTCVDDDTVYRIVVNIKSKRNEDEIARRWKLLGERTKEVNPEKEERLDIGRWALNSRCRYKQVGPARWTLYR